MFAERAKNHYQSKEHHSFPLHMLKERTIYLPCSCNYSRKDTGGLSTLVSKFQLGQAVTVTIKQKIFSRLHVLCEEISKLKYGHICYGVLT